MGHLVNPTAFRLGFFSNWHDNWIVSQNVVYTEVLHNTLSIRRILEFFFEDICKQTSPELIFSHYSMQYMSSSFLNVKVFFYDSEVEKKFQGLYRICRKLNKNQKMLFNQLLNIFNIYNYTLGSKNIKSRRLLYRWFIDRGFFDYLLLRRLVFFFFLILAKEKVFDSYKLLKLRGFLVVFLEYFWRKAIYLNKGNINVFDFFSKFFLCCNWLLKDKNSSFDWDRYRFYIRTNKRSKNVGFIDELNKQIKYKNINDYMSWVDFESLCANDSNDLIDQIAADFAFSDEESLLTTPTGYFKSNNDSWVNTKSFKKFKTLLLNDTVVYSNVIQKQYSLLIWKFLKLSHSVWYSRQSLLKNLLRSGFVRYRTLYRKIRKYPTALNIWSMETFLDFYRLFLVSTRYQVLLGNLKRLVSPFLNRLSMYPITVSFWGFDNDLVTAEFVSSYLAKKFEQRFQIKELFGPISKDLRRIMGRTPLLLGYKLQFVGRLTRRDRLRTSWVMAGKVPVSTISARVEHGVSFGVLRNGVCSIRVWLYRSKFFGNNRLMYLYKVNV